MQTNVEEIKARVQRKYFHSYDNDCKEHDVTRCRDCTECMIDDIAEAIQDEQDDYCDAASLEGSSKALVEITTNVNQGSNAECKKAVAVEAFSKQLEMLQTITGISDEKLDKIKVADLPKLVEAAKKKATVGHMKKLLGPRPGFIEKLLCRIH